MEPATVMSLRRPFLVQAFDRQKTRRINLALFRQIVRRLLGGLPPVRGQAGPAESAPPGGQLAVHFINAAAMARLNHDFLGHAGSTDVITFNYQEIPGRGGLCAEIFISVDDAVVCAPRFHSSWQSELVRYLVHGVLHLRGYDDLRPNARREMKEWEDRLCRQLSERFEFSGLERL
jgi:probable rRNA maturation factor